jgi:DNA-binding CsgD family transcriptional regulator
MQYSVHTTAATTRCGTQADVPGTCAAVPGDRGRYRAKPVAMPATAALAEVAQSGAEICRVRRESVAAALYLSVATVKTHISWLLDKLSCRDRAQLVVGAYETGLAVAGQQ